MAGTDELPARCPDGRSSSASAPRSRTFSSRLSGWGGRAPRSPRCSTSTRSTGPSRPSTRTARCSQTEQRSETEPGAGGEGGGQVVINNNYQNSRRVEKSVGSVGKVTRLTVAVLVDEERSRAVKEPRDRSIWRASRSMVCERHRRRQHARRPPQRARRAVRGGAPPVAETDADTPAGKPKPDSCHRRAGGPLLVGVIADRGPADPRAAGA